MDYSKYEKSGETRGGFQVRKEVIAVILESFFGLGLSITQISINTGVAVTSVSKYIKYGIGTPRSENTKIIVLKSKV